MLLALLLGGIGGRGGGLARYCSSRVEDANEGGECGVADVDGCVLGGGATGGAGCAVVVGGAAAASVVCVDGTAAAAAGAPTTAARSAAFCLRNASSCGGAWMHVVYASGTTMGTIAVPCGAQPLQDPFWWAVLLL